MSVSDENIAKLTIAEAYSEDEGEYVCTATNKFGSTSSSCKLFVEGTLEYQISRLCAGKFTIVVLLRIINKQSVQDSHNDFINRDQPYFTPQHTKRAIENKPSIDVLTFRKTRAMRDQEDDYLYF